MLLLWLLLLLLLLLLCSCVTRQYYIAQRHSTRHASCGEIVKNVDSVSVPRRLAWRGTAAASLCCGCWSCGVFSRRTGSYFLLREPHHDWIICIFFRKSKPKKKKTPSTGGSAVRFIGRAGYHSPRTYARALYRSQPNKRDD